ncbi:MAG TPA: trehalose-phosphatase [Steroidobacteraceae bacterium]|jgi:trehalose 6-phosphate phosphatase|nr:trehalose-phosphatase [Steroidobacteraceae bacterium]
MKQSPPPPALDWCLFLDVDGTLVDLTDTPSETTADLEIKSLLREIAERLGGAVALVSGRQIATLDQMFAPLTLPAAGLHGVERRRADGTIMGASFVDSQLDRARTALSALVAAHPGTLLEDKDRTIGLHFRMAPQFEQALREAVVAIAKPLGSNYHIQGGKMLFEIKPRGFSKATAIQAFMKEPPFSGRRPVFVGDDLTDQDGFGMVEAHGGISVGVGDRVQGQFYLADVNAVRGWLRQLADLKDTHHA